MLPPEDEELDEEELLLEDEELLDELDELLLEEELELLDELLLDDEDELEEEELEQAPSCVHTCQGPELVVGFAPWVHQFAVYAFASCWTWVPLVNTDEALHTGRPSQLTANASPETRAAPVRATDATAFLNIIILQRLNILGTFHLLFLCIRRERNIHESL